MDVPVGLTISEVDQLMRELRLEDLRVKVANKELELADEDVIMIRSFMQLSRLHLAARTLPTTRVQQSRAEDQHTRAAS